MLSGSLQKTHTIYINVILLYSTVSNANNKRHSTTTLLIPSGFWNVINPPLTSLLEYTETIIVISVFSDGAVQSVLQVRCSLQCQKATQLQQKSAGLGSQRVRLQYLGCLATSTSCGFQPETRGGYLAWISCIYILKLIPWANTRVACSVYTGTRYSLCHGVDNSKCHLDCQSGCVLDSGQPSM